jgi:GMP synthase (glutamine-hydrolysing)
MKEKEGLIYIMDMESSLSGALARRVMDMDQHIIYRKWSMEVDVEAELKAYAKVLRGIIISGSAKNINSKKSLPPRVSPEFFKAGVPILGICYGHQLFGHITGQKIIRCWDEPDEAKRTKEARKKDKGEQGPTEITLTEEGKASKLFKGLAETFPVWMKHNWMVDALPPEWKLLASTEKCPIAAMEIGPYYSVQFHPEPFNSLYGKIVLHNFMQEICGVETPYF